MVPLSLRSRYLICVSEAQQEGEEKAYSQGPDPRAQAAREKIPLLPPQRVEIGSKDDGQGF